MKFAKNQEKQRRTPKAAPGGATGPFKRKTPNPMGKFAQRDPFFKDATNAGSRINKVHELVRNSSLVVETTPTKIKRRQSTLGVKTEFETPSKRAPKKQLPYSEGRVQRSISDADDWLETPVEHELVLPTKLIEENDKVGSEDSQSPTESSDEDESESPEQNEGSDEEENDKVVKEDSPTESSDENESESPEQNESPPADMPDEDEDEKRAGVPMFSGTSTLNSPAEEKAKKYKGRQSKLMSQLHEGNPAILDKLSHFEDKVKRLSACGKLSKSQRKLLGKYRKCVGVVEKIKAGDLSFIAEKTVPDVQNVNVPDVQNLKQEPDTVVTAIDKNVKQKGGDGATSKKTRYVLFVGNLPYVIDHYRISEHFKKAGKVTSVRIPVNKETNQSRGFAFVEFTNKESYEKALSMHHTFIDSRRINVLYTNSKEQTAKAPPSKKKDMKVKNLKLAAMRKQGLLAGSVKESQKRSTRRRAKKNKASVEG